MALQPGNRTTVYFQEQSGSTIPSGGTWLQLPRTGGSGLALERGSITDETITPTSQQVDSISGNNDVSGSWDVVARPVIYNPFWESVLKNDFAGTVSSSSLATIAFTAASGGTEATITNLPGTPAAGDVYILSGSANAGNNGVVYVESVDTGTVSTRSLTIVTEAAGASITATKLSTLVKGTAVSKRFAFVEELPQLIGFRTSLGVECESISLSSANEESFATSTYTFSGDSQTFPTADPIQAAGGTKSNTSPTARGGFVHFDGAFMFDGGTATLASIEVTVETPLTDVYVWGDRNKFGVIDGITTVSGTQVYIFANAVQYDAFLADTRSIATLRLKENGVEGNTGVGEMVMIFPRQSFQSPTVDIPADGPVTVSFPFEATVGGNVTHSVSVASGS